VPFKIKSLYGRIALCIFIKEPPPYCLRISPFEKFLKQTGRKFSLAKERRDPNKVASDLSAIRSNWGVSAKGMGVGKGEESCSHPSDNPSRLETTQQLVHMTMLLSGNYPLCFNLSA
ncbi:hypothetical protein CEXT_75801, partial [Caerostris extrusa]